MLELPIFWNAFPKSLLARFGRERAMVLADMLWPYSSLERSDPDFDPLSAQFAHDGSAATQPLARPQNEYCEWRVERHPRSNQIQRVIFTAETSEYWEALFGGNVMGVSKTGVEFSGNRDWVARQYEHLVRAPVLPIDLCAPGSSNYDPLNRWNATHGLVHMSHPDNKLPAAIRLCADSTLLFAHADGTPLTSPEAVCCAGGGANPSRASDLTVVGTGNALARQGVRLALAEPFGIYIHHVDTSGWRLPGLKEPAQCCCVARGLPGKALRVVVEAPASAGCLLHELTIGGEPLTHGGQIAECITMRASVLATRARGAANAAREPLATGFLRESNRSLLGSMSVGSAPVAGHMAAFRRRP